MDLSELLDSEMTVRSMTIRPRHEAFVKGVAQASDGLCCVFSAGQGNLFFVAPRDRVADLNVLIDDLEVELASC
jgi:hypothetical protein